MSVSEPLGVTMRTRHETSTVDGLRLVESDPLAEELRHQRRAPRPTRDPAEPVRSLPSSAIHQLRTPLTSIHGYAQVLQRGLADDARAMNSLAVIVRESGCLTQMLAELSDLAELSESTDAATDGSRCVVDVRELIEVVAETVAAHDPDEH